MNLRTIALKNIIRRKAKMALVIAGLAVGIATLVAIVTVMLAFQKSVNQKIDTFGFNIVIYPGSSNLSLDYGGMTVSGVDTYESRSLREADVANIKRMKGAEKLAVVSPKLLQVTEVAGKQALLVGTSFDQELAIKKWWRMEGKKPSGSNELILGLDAARTLGVNVGDRLTLNGKSFRVSAVLKSTGSQDDALIFADLDEIQSLYNRGDELSLIEVSAKSSRDIDAVVKDLEKAVPLASVSSVKQAVEYKEKAAGSLAKFGLTISAIIMVISGIVVFTTMMTSVRDRKREIGIFRAMGYRQSAIARIILIEAFVLSLIGGAIGYFIGFGSVYAVPVFLEKVELAVEASVPVLIISIGISVLVGLISSLIPAKRASDMDPAEALKTL